MPPVLSSSERLFPTLTPAQISRIAAHGQRRPMSCGAVLVNVAMAGAVFPGAAEDLSRANWPLSRAQYLLETSPPGIFAVGDVRSGNVKRVASAVGEGSIAVAFVHQVLRQ